MDNSICFGSEQDGCANRDLADLYRDFVDADDDSRASECLSVLIDRSVEPLIREIVRRKFGVSLRESDERQGNQTAFDIVSEVKTKIVAELSHQRVGKRADRINNLEAYVRKTAANAANHYIRQKNPHRLRLKNQLRYLLSHDRRFSLWRSDEGIWLCGKSKDRTERSISVKGACEDLRSKLEATGIFADRADLVELVAGVFDHCEGVLSFNDLIGLIFELRKLTEPIQIDDEALSEGRPSQPEDDVLDQLERTAYVGQLWREICKLPMRHRAALLFNLRDQNGDGLIVIFPIARAATISEIAQALGFSVDEFATIWNELPWDDQRIAEYLGLTRQQVINLRQSARMALRKRIKRP